jgi:hypothetical protein
MVPLLSRGKHRNPRKGACFMELASYLAGERWSDHPSCTHPLLAGLARLVNDYTSDEARPKLAGLIPSVIGLNSDDPRVDARIALVCATTAVPVVAADLQLAMAVSVLAAEHVLAELDGRPDGEPSERSRRALEQVPLAARRAYQFRRGIWISPKGFRRFAAPNTVHLAARGIAQACVTRPDDMLRDLLRDAIAECEAVIRRAPDPAVEQAAWDAACRMTGAGEGA